MQSQYPSPESPVRVVEWRATINGEVFTNVKVSGMRMSAGSAEGGRIAGGGIVEGAVSISVPPGSKRGLVTHGVTPWGRNGGAWPPLQGDPVTLELMQGGEWIRQFTGVVDIADGELPAGWTAIDCVDPSSSLGGSISIAALAADMPAPVAGAPLMRVALKSEYVVDLCLRAAGFFATPRMESGCVLSIPMQGSFWPERGTVAASTPIDAAAPTWKPGATRLRMGNVNAKYTPAGPSATLSYSAAPVEVTLQNDEGTGSAALRLTWSDGSTMRFIRISSSLLYAYVDETRVVTLAAPGWSTATLRCDGATWELRTDNAASAPATAVLPSTLGTATLTMVEVITTSSTYTSGVQIVRPPSGAFRSVAYEQTVEYRTGTDQWSLGVVPEMLNRDRRDLINEIAKATLAVAFFDESGKFIWWHQDLFRRSRSPQTITQSGYAKIPWQSSMAASAAVVEVKSRQPVAATLWTRPRVQIADGTDQQVDPGQTLEQWIEPPADEIWIEPSTPLDVVTLPRTGTGMASGSIIAATMTDSAGVERLATSADYTASLTKITSQKLKLTISRTASAGTFSTHAPDTTDVPKAWRGRPVPTIRAHGRYTLADDLYTATKRGARGRTYTHDAGIWWQQGQGRETNGPLVNGANLLAAMLIDKPASIPGLPARPDGRWQIGDTLIIDLPDEGVQIEGPIIDKSGSGGPGELTQDLQITVVTVRSRVRVRDVDARLQDQLIRDVDARNSTSTISQLDADIGPI